MSMLKPVEDPLPKLEKTGVHGDAPTLGREGHTPCDSNSHPCYQQGFHIPSQIFEGSGPSSCLSALVLQTREQVGDGTHYHVPFQNGDGSDYHVPCRDEDENDYHVHHKHGQQPRGREPNNDH